jgi:hypothetical protein
LSVPRAEAEEAADWVAAGGSAVVPRYALEAPALRGLMEGAACSEVGRLECGPSLRLGGGSRRPSCRRS